MNKPWCRQRRLSGYTIRKGLSGCRPHWEQRGGGKERLAASCGDACMWEPAFCQNSTTVVQSGLSLLLEAHLLLLQHHNTAHCSSHHREADAVIHIRHVGRRFRSWVWRAQVASTSTRRGAAAPCTAGRRSCARCGARRRGPDGRAGGEAARGSSRRIVIVVVSVIIRTSRWKATVRAAAGIARLCRARPCLDPA